MTAKIKNKSKVPGLLKNLLKPVLSIVILSTFVLIIFTIVQNLWDLDVSKFMRITDKALNKVNIDIDENKVGEVAGKFVERISQTDLGSGVSDFRPAKEEVLKIGILSDIHEDEKNLNSAIERIKQLNITTVFFLGDATNYGDQPALRLEKEMLDKFGLEYYILPGDHDLAQSAGPENFQSVFGGSNRVLSLKGVSFVLFNNSANFTKLEQKDMDWLTSSLNGADFLVLSQPIYADDLLPPFNKLFMGSTNGEVPQEKIVLQEDVRAQRDQILDLVRHSNVRALISGDHHKSSNKIDPANDKLSHLVVGAVSGEINGYSQNVIQSPRVATLTVYEDKSYIFEDVVLD